MVTEDCLRNSKSPWTNKNRFLWQWIASCGAEFSDWITRLRRGQSSRSFENCGVVCWCWRSLTWTNF